MPELRLLPCPMYVEFVSLRRPWGGGGCQSYAFPPCPIRSILAQVPRIFPVLYNRLFFFERITQSRDTLFGLVHPTVVRWYHTSRPPILVVPYPVLTRLIYMSRAILLFVHGGGYGTLLSHCLPYTVPYRGGTFESDTS